MHVKFHIDKWVPEVKGRMSAHWQSVFVVDPGSTAELPDILAARRNAITTARQMETKTTTRWRVRKIEQEVIYEREAIQSHSWVPDSDNAAGDRRSRVAAICSPRTKPRLVSKTPWRIESNHPRMSAVVDSEGRLVCGSLLCKQDPRTIKNHKIIVEAVNKL